MPLPDALRLREIKYGDKTTNELRIRTAELMLQEGRLAEALDLYVLAGHDEGVAHMRQLAQERGRPWLLLMLRRAGRAVAAEEWKRAGTAAESDERWRDAYRAFLEADDEEGLARIRERIPEYEVYIPQGK